MNTVLMYDGGLQTVTPLQVVYLDFDGANTAYHGEVLTIEGVTVQNSGLTDTDISTLTERLNTAYQGTIKFVTERPLSGDYSTVYVGATDAFAYHGLAETVDVGNKNHGDNAFVNLRGSESLETIQEIISHEVGHLTGTLDHGGDGLAAYAAGYYISSGVTSTGVVLSAFNSMFISSGGVANSTIVNELGQMYIYSGGLANNTTLNADGSIAIYSSGLASNTTVNDGFIGIFWGGVAKNTTITGSMNINPGGRADNTLINNGKINIYSGGVVNNTIVNADGYLHVFSGATANDTTVNSYGNMYISSGGRGNGTIINEEGSMTVKNGGIASDTTVNYMGSMVISSGGTANSTIINSGTVTISSGGIANNTSVNDLGELYVYSGGTANNTIVNSGTLIVRSGGSALSVDWTPCVGQIKTENGAYVTYQRTYSGCYIGENDQLLSQTMTMTGDVISGSVCIMSGGVAKNITTVNGGTINIFSGGITDKAAVNDYMYISTGGVANDTVINENGYGYVLFGGTANNTLIASGGYMYIMPDGIAHNTTVNGGLDIYSGATADGVTVNSGGWLDLSSGSKLTGSLTFAAGSSVTADKDAEINFDLTGRTAGDGYLINNLSLIDGAPDYTITVSVTQATGIYKLAQGADSFTQTISIGDGVKVFGNLSVDGNAIKYGNYEYSLLQNNGNLSLSIVVTDNIAPTITNISASPTGLTNKNVLVSAVFADNVELALSQYKIGDGDWTNYTGAISVASNATVYFKAIDTSDNEATAQYDVKNILAVDPKGPGNVTPSTKVNKYDATVSWQAPITQDKAKIVSYEVYVNGQLTSVKTPSLTLKAMQVSVGNTVQIRALDSLGRYGALSQTITFDIKDVTAPVLGKVTTALDQYTATVNYSGSDNVGIDHYQVKCGGQTQTLAGTSATFNTLALGINNVEVIAFDAAGNASKAVTAKITVKDVTAPDQVTGLAAPAVDSKYKATLSWSAGVDNSGSVASYEIQLDNGKILKSTKTTLAINSLAVGQHSYQVRAIDKAKNIGEWSAAKVFTVLDTTAPGTVSVKAVVAQNSILLSWKASADNVGVTGYQVWGGASPSTMTMEQALSADQLSCVLTNIPKGVYYMDVRAVDAANNVSASRPAKVTVSTALPVSSLAMSSSHVDLLTWSSPNQTSFALASGL